MKLSYCVCVQRTEILTTQGKLQLGYGNKVKFGDRARPDKILYGITKEIHKYLISWTEQL